MFFGPPPTAGGRTPPASPTSNGLLESGASCVLQYANPTDNAGPGLYYVVEQSADGSGGWSEIARGVPSGTGNQGVTISDAADPDDPIYYRLWLERGGSRSPAAASYTRLAAPVIITITIDPPGSGTATGAGGYVKDTTATMVATPASGYQFDSWREPVNVASYDNPYAFTATVDRDLVARFTEIPPGPWTIAASVSPGASGSVSGDGSYANNATVNLVATPASGYQFVRWTEGGSQVSTNANYSFTATAGRTLVAVFELIPVTWEITATPSDPFMGGTTGSGYYADGATVNLTATPEPGCWFIRWSVGGVQVSTNANYSFTATADRVLVAEFGTDV